MKGSNMNKYLLPLLVGVTAAAIPAFAEDLSPGLWEIKMESRVPSNSGWAPSPFTLTQCLTAGDAQDPTKLIGSIATPGATGCSYTEKSYSGSTFRFAVDCAGAYGLRSKGSVTFGANSFNGDITATASVGGQATEFKNRVSGRRIGGC